MNFRTESPTIRKSGPIISANKSYCDGMSTSSVLPATTWLTVYTTTSTWTYQLPPVDMEFSPTTRQANICSSIANTKTAHAIVDTNVPAGHAAERFKDSHPHQIAETASDTARDRSGFSGGIDLLDKRT